MILGALIDLGVPLPWIKESIAELPLSDFDIRVDQVNYNGIRAAKAEVRTLGEHHHRHYSDIRGLIEGSSLPDPVKQTAAAVFRRLAEAEAGVHGCRTENVHFHEVGAVDAIVDVVGAALGLHHLGVTAAAAAAVPNGRGFVTCRHGRLPIPAPATVSILKGIPTYGVDLEYELTTPTGAAIVATVAQRFGSMPQMKTAAVGYGAGRRNLDPGPNLLRIMLGEEGQGELRAEIKFMQDQIVVIESNIDDMNPELFGFLMDRLFEEGALDVGYLPIQMKKNRPGTQLQVLCRPNEVNAIAGCILSETTSLGVRYHEAGRFILERDQVMLESSFGAIPVKRIRYPKGESRLVPEFEVCKSIALAKGLPLRSVYDTVVREAAERKRMEEKDPIA